MKRIRAFAPTEPHVAAAMRSTPAAHAAARLIPRRIGALGWTAPLLDQRGAVGPRKPSRLSAAVSASRMGRR
ncbi:hypothetical protein [Nocardia abscessus]|uniref:hypothetical protein n=1 Tax=Nocardia abscessus TaxID=120957 RepID=UPI0024589AB2|nr:hypothetical protein [Nocardia abscessus]